MTTRMPAGGIRATAAGTLGRSGSASPTSPRNSKGELARRFRPCRAARQDARAPRQAPACPCARHLVDARDASRRARRPARRQSSAIGLGGALAQRRQRRPIRASQTLVTASKIGAQPVFPSQRKSAMRCVGWPEAARLRARETPSPSGQTARARWRGCRSETRSAVAPTGGAPPLARQLSRRRSRSSTIVMRFCVRVPVLSVHSTVAAAQRLDRRDAARQYPGPRDAPRAHHHEDREDQREFLGQHRHAERDAAQYCSEPSAAQNAVKRHGKRGER